jgi:hypothetical protein
VVPQAEYATDLPQQQQQLLTATRCDQLTHCASLLRVELCVTIDIPPICVQPHHSSHVQNLCVACLLSCRCCRTLGGECGALRVQDRQQHTPAAVPAATARQQPVRVGAACLAHTSEAIFVNKSQCCGRSHVRLVGQKVGVHGQNTGVLWADRKRHRTTSCRMCCVEVPGCVGTRATVYLHSVLQ